MGKNTWIVLGIVALILAVVILGGSYYLHYHGPRGEYTLATRAAVTASAGTAQAVIAAQSTQLAQLSATQTAAAMPSATPATEYCSKQRVDRAYQRFTDMVGMFAQIVALPDAGTTRDELRYLVLQLQGIRATASQVDVPPCMEATQQYLLDYMDITITGYNNLVILGSLPVNWVEDSEAAAGKFATELQRILLCAPNCR